MRNSKEFKNIRRIIDANINRIKEGLRVCEEITRFLLESKSLTAEFKALRHRIDSVIKKIPDNCSLIKERRSCQDVGKDIRANELKRKGAKDIFFANIQRVKESLRVMEEFSKLFNTRIALDFKNLRYYAYEIEKKAAQRLASLRNP
ncbi:MAG: thiamine-phosphate pyrophosphorylase [Candidatus Omnitrophota bacterium]